MLTEIATILSLFLPIGWIVKTTNWKKVKRNLKRSVAVRIDSSIETF